MTLTFGSSNVSSTPQQDWLFACGSSTAYRQRCETSSVGCLSGKGSMISSCVYWFSGAQPSTQLSVEYVLAGRGQSRTSFSCTLRSHRSTDKDSISTCNSLLAPPRNNQQPLVSFRRHLKTWTVLLFLARSWLSYINWTVLNWTELNWTGSWLSFSTNCGRDSGSN